MKRSLLALTILFLMSTQLCFAHITSYRSIFNNYLQIQSTVELEVAETGQKFSLSVYHDATFPDKTRDPKGSVFETKFFQITFPELKKDAPMQDEQEQIAFNEKQPPYFIIDNKKFEFSKIFLSGLVSENTIRSEFQKKTPPLFTESKNIAIVFTISKDKQINVAIPEEILTEWRYVLTMDMQEEHKKQL